MVTPSHTATFVPTVATASPATELSEEDWISKQNPIPGLAWSADGNAIAVVALSGVYIFDTRTNSIIYTLEEGEFLFPLVMDPQGQHLFAGNRVWDVASGQLLYQLPLANLSAAAFNPEGKILVVSDGNRVTLWDALIGKLQKSLDVRLGDAEQGLVYSPNGNLLYIISSDHSVKRMDLVSGKFSQIFSLPEDSCCIIFSPDTKYMIVNRPNHGAGSKQLWDMEHGELLKDLGPCDSDVYLSAFSPDSRYFVIGPCASDAQLWNTSTQQLLHSFSSASLPEIHPEWRSAVFSPDGTKIAFGNDIGEVLIWDVNSYQLINKLSIPLPSSATNK